MRVIAGLVVVAIIAVVAIAFYERHQRALTAAEEARDAECREVRQIAEGERLPDGTFPSDSRMLGIRFDVCAQEGR